MATNDVPGANPVNGDKLAIGCWAEHEDGSLLLVEGITDTGKVVFLMFDMTKTPILTYRDGMERKDFEKKFSWNVAGASSKVKWTWHDKTPFPWEERVNFRGATDGPQPVSAADQLSAAEQVAKSLGLQAEELEARWRRAGPRPGSNPLAAIWEPLRNIIDDALGTRHSDDGQQ